MAGGRYQIDAVKVETDWSKNIFSLMFTTDLKTVDTATLYSV